MPEIVSNSVLPATREHITLHTSDGLALVGELAMPLHPVRHTIICLHPNPLQNGYMDSHVLRKLSWRFPALFDCAVLRFNFRGVSSKAGTSEGTHGYSIDEGKDLIAAVEFAKSRGLPRPWLVGWSFGTDVTLRHGSQLDIAGAVLLSPPLKWTTPDELDIWAASDKPLVCAVPEFDDFLKPDEARERFARIPQAKVIAAPGAKHLWIGEQQVRQALEVIAQTVVGPSAVLPDAWDGPMERWVDER
jgi:alpha/beta superfamily hydrolase